MDLKLTSGDIDLTDGDLSWVTGLDAIRQDIEMKLGTWLGETPYDKAAGMPYLQIIFERGTPATAVRFLVEDQLLRVPGVSEVLELLIEVDGPTREATITGTVRVDTGEALQFSTGAITP